MSYLFLKFSKSL